MKFKSETEMCKEVTKVIIGGIIPDAKIIAIPEPPKDYYSNDHADMLLIDKTNRKLMMIEYKLGNYKKLRDQIPNRTGIRTIGIINSVPRITEQELLKDGIYSYDESDSSVIKIIEATRLAVGYPVSQWTSIYEGWGMVYWWGYMYAKHSLNGGLDKNAKRPTFHHLYTDAIRNLQNAYGRVLKLTEVGAILRCGYGENTMKKYYKKAMSKPQHTERR